VTVLNTLTFAKYTVPANSDPVTKRRKKLLDKLDEQILLATNTDYTPTKRVTTTDSEGKTRVIEKPKRLKRWWTVQADGKVLLTVRNGARAIEFQKSRDAIEVESVEALPAMLQTVRRAVADGELDELLAKYAQYGRAVKKK